MPNWPVAALFDFDGVIVNSEPLHFHAFHEVLHEEKLELTEQEYYEELIGFDDRGAFKHIFQKHNKPLEPRTLLRVMTRKSEAMMELIRDRRYKALPGVEEFVRGLWRNYPLAIVSGALREEIEVMLEGVSLRDCFSAIVSAQDVSVGKPDPQGYLLATRMIGEKLKRPGNQKAYSPTPREFLIIEDASSVCRTTRAAGFQVLGVATTTSVERLIEAGANWAVRSLRPDEVREKIPGLKIGIEG
ncbi:MAG: HAD family hydrolase [Tepidisphaeraceae bacterium]